jgi:hypothetical protein
MTKKDAEDWCASGGGGASATITTPDTTIGSASYCNLK